MAPAKRRMNWIGALQRNRVANSLVKTLRIHRLADFGLNRHPLKRKTAHGFTYCVESTASLVVAKEIFDTDMYARAVALVQPVTFIDLGANVGFFPVLLAEVMQPRHIKGLCIEPNPHLHSAVEFHLRQNSLDGVHLVRGAVTAGGDAATIDFYLHPSHIASSVSGDFNPWVAVGGKVERVKVAVINLAAEWARHFPNERVNLLKIDIEGAEAGFLRSNASFLTCVDAILIEWHKWVTTLDEIKEVLRAGKFGLDTIADEDSHVGTALFRRIP